MQRGPDRSSIIRRRVLALLAIAGVGIAAWLLLRGASDGAQGDADARGAMVDRVVIESEEVGRSQPVTIVTPEAAEQGSPLLVFLHGYGGDESGFLDHDPLFAALEQLGAAAPIVAFPDGGEGSYWHNRESGDWGDYVADEVIPAVVEESGADGDRVAIGGISMGGFGAYDIARLHPGRFCAVGGHSPAIWQSAGETAPGAFDDAEDFAHHNVIAAVSADPEAFSDQPIWLDTGDEDPFVPGVDAFAAALDSIGAPLTEKRWPGGHDGEYWASHWDEYMGFYADALQDCGQVPA
jgi:S-formylglutathione hydrolase FrmB